MQLFFSTPLKIFSTLTKYIYVFYSLPGKNVRQFFESDKRLGYAFSPYRRDVEVGWELLLDPWEVGLLKCVWKVCTHNPLASEQFPQEVLSHDPNVSGLVENHQFLKEQMNNNNKKNKGQTISKANCGVLNSPKKTNAGIIFTTYNYPNICLLGDLTDSVIPFIGDLLLFPYF